MLHFKNSLVPGISHLHLGLNVEDISKEYDDYYFYIFYPAIIFKLKFNNNW